MSDAAPDALPFAGPPRRDRRIVATAALSIAAHLLVLGWILLPRAPAPPPEAPEAVSVELVPPSEVSSIEPSISSAPPSSEAPSSEAPSSAPASSEAPSSEAASSEAASSAEPVSSQPPASDVSASEAPSSAVAAAASSADPKAAPSTETAPSSAETASAETAAPPTVIPVGPGEASSGTPAENSSVLEESSSAAAESSADTASAAEAASEETLLAASGAATSEGVAPAAASSGSSEAAAAGPPPPDAALLHSAKRFYLADMLDAPALAKARAALKKLPPEKRLAQTCNIEAIGQIGKAPGDFEPDALVANAFAPPSVSVPSYGVSNGAFRSRGKWYAIAYQCTLSKDLGSVTAFAFHIGDEVGAAMEARYGGGQAAGASGKGRN